MILTAYLPSSASIRLLCWKTMQRKVLGKYLQFRPSLPVSLSLKRPFLALAAEALKAMGLLSKAPVSREDKLLVPETAASHLLKLAAQIALEVTFRLLNIEP